MPARASGRDTREFGGTAREGEAMRAQNSESRASR